MDALIHRRAYYSKEKETFGFQNYKVLSEDILRSLNFTSVTKTLISHDPFDIKMDFLMIPNLKLFEFCLGSILNLNEKFSRKVFPFEV